MPSNTNIKREENDESTTGGYEESISVARAAVLAAVDASANNERDSSNNNNNNNSSSSNSSNQQFPWKLWDLLSEVERNGDDDAISWVPGTDAFKVHNKQKFANQILPAYFNATKYKSFQRNLNLWGFETITEGPNKGACFHKLFVRNNRDKCHYMSRQKVKGGGTGTGVKEATKQEASLRPQSPGGQNNGMTLSKRKSSSMSGLGRAAKKAAAAAAVRREMAPMVPPSGERNHQGMVSTNTAAAAAAFTAATTNQLMFPRGGGGGGGGGPSLSTTAAAPFSSLSPPDDLKQLSFTQKIHHFLSQEEYDDCVTWTPDGRCIRIVDPFRFQERISPKYFSYTSFSSFLCELSDYGFQKISHAGFDECYYHDMVIRDCQHLCKYVSTPEAARRFVSENPTLDLAFGDQPPPSPPSSQRGSDTPTPASSLPPSQSTDLAHNLAGLLPSIQASEIVRLQQQIQQEQRQRQEQQQLQTIAGLDPLLQQLIQGARAAGASGHHGGSSSNFTVDNTTGAAPATTNSATTATTSLQQLQQLQSSLNPALLLGNLAAGHHGGNSSGLNIDNTSAAAPATNNNTATSSLQQLQSSLNPSLLLGGAVAGAGVGNSTAASSMAQAISSLFSSSAAVDASQSRPPSSIAAFLSNSRSSAAGDDGSSSRGGGVNTNVGNYTEV